MRNTLLFSILMLCSLVSVTCHASLSISDIQFENYSVKDGLTQSAVLDVVEDHQGFLWIATMDGLNRFDGYDFVQYRPDDNNPHSLPGPLIRQLFIDSSDTLWVATDKGLARYRSQTNDFAMINSRNSQLTSDEIWSISQLDQGKLLISD